MGSQATSRAEGVLVDTLEEVLVREWKPGVPVMTLFERRMMDLLQRKLEFELMNKLICDCGQAYDSMAGVEACQAAGHSAALGNELVDAEAAARQVGEPPIRKPPRKEHPRRPVVLEAFCVDDPHQEAQEPRPQGETLEAAPKANSAPGSREAEGEGKEEVLLELTGKQVMDLWELMGEDEEERVTIARGPKFHDHDEQKTYPAGLRAWLSDYPDEGVIPLE